MILGLFLCVGFVEPFNGLRSIIDLVTGNTDHEYVAENEPIDAEHDRFYDDEQIETDVEESYADRTKPHHQHYGAQVDGQKPPVPLPPPISLPPHPPLFKPKPTVTATKTIYAEVRMSTIYFFLQAIPHVAVPVVN